MQFNWGPVLNHVFVQNKGQFYVYGCAVCVCCVLQQNNHIACYKVFKIKLDIMCLSLPGHNNFQRQCSFANSSVICCVIKCVYSRIYIDFYK